MKFERPATATQIWIKNQPEQLKRVGSNPANLERGILGLDFFEALCQ